MEFLLIAFMMFCGLVVATNVAAIILSILLVAVVLSWMPWWLVALLVAAVFFGDIIGENEST
jgi:hypothetical protein